MTDTTIEKPEYLTRLEAAYGKPGQSGFGSAVFFERLRDGDDLTSTALAKYKFFVGDLWARYGEQAWMAPWKQVYVRAAGAAPDIVSELRGISDPDASRSVPMLLDAVEGADAARAALAAAFDQSGVDELRVFNLGDGEAMSGLLIAGRLADSGESAFVVFLMD